MNTRALAFLVCGALAALGCRGQTDAEQGPLAAGQTGVRALSVNGAYVYWTMAAGSVRRVSIDGGKVETLVDGLHIPDQLAVDDTDVYLSTLDGEIVRVPKTGGAATQLADAQNDVVGVQLDDVFVYWATREGDVRRLPKNGGEAALLASAPGGLSAIAQQGAEIYWTAGSTNGALDSISGDGNATATTLVDGLGSPRQLAVAPSNAFWVATGTDPNDPNRTVPTISAVTLEGDEVPVMPNSDVRTISSDVGAVAALVGDDSLVFVAANPNSTKTTFASLSAAGGPDAHGKVYRPVSFAEGAAGTPSMALDDTNVYWTSSGDGNIFSLPKSATASATP